MRRSSSISSISSEEDTMQIFVKNVSGTTTIPLTISPNTTISTLRTLLSLRFSESQSSTASSASDDFRLVHAGKHLSSASTTLSDYSIPPNSTLHLALPIRGGMPPKKIRCSFKDCKDRAQPIVGDCGFCTGRFCGKHRLLEDHKCDGLEDCKKESHERNANKLNSERTVAIKGV